MATPQSYYPLFDSDCLREVFPLIKKLIVIRDEKGNICLVMGKLEHNRVCEPEVSVTFTFPGSKQPAVRRLVDTLEKWLPNELVCRVTDPHLRMLNA